MPQSEQGLAAPPDGIFLSHGDSEISSLARNKPPRQSIPQIFSTAGDAMQVLIRSFPQEFCDRKMYVFEQRISFLLRTVNTLRALRMKHKLDNFWTAEAFLQSFFEKVGVLVRKRGRTEHWQAAILCVLLARSAFRRPFSNFYLVQINTNYINMLYWLGSKYSPNISSNFPLWKVKAYLYTNIRGR